MNEQAQVPEDIRALFCDAAERAGFEYKRVWVGSQMVFVLLWGLVFIAAYYEKTVLMLACVLSVGFVMGGVYVYTRQGLGPFIITMGGSWLSRWGLSRKFEISSRVYPTTAETFTPVPKRLVDRADAPCGAEIEKILANLTARDTALEAMFSKYTIQGQLTRHDAVNLAVFYVATRPPANL